VGNLDHFPGRCAADVAVEIADDVHADALSFMVALCDALKSQKPRRCLAVSAVLLAL
jgi:hypothetical protein